jgi:hypothetical protein
MVRENGAAQVSSAERNGVVSAVLCNDLALACADSGASGTRGRAFESRRAHAATDYPDHASVWAVFLFLASRRCGVNSRDEPSIRRRS